MSTATFLRSRSQNELCLAAGAMVLVVGYADFVTGYNMSFFLFYAGPIMFSVWFANRQSCTLVVLFSAIVWWWADWKSGHPYLNDWGQIWETVVRLIFFSFVSIGGSAIKTKHEAIESQLEALSRTRNLEREIVSASESEQQRIGQDLHDGLCQCLAAIGCAASSLKDDLHARFLPEAGDAAEIEKLLREAVMEARNIARGIAPVHMDDAGLPSAIEELAANVSRLAGVECVFKGDHSATLANPNTATHLYRIAQEATNNAIKHGSPSRVEIALEREAGKLILTVRDNGGGFGSSAADAQGMGLKTMSYRARLIGADLQITNTGSGTLVSCDLPMPQRVSSQGSPPNV